MGIISFKYQHLLKWNWKKKITFSVTYPSLKLGITLHLKNTQEKKKLCVHFVTYKILIFIWLFGLEPNYWNNSLPENTNFEKYGGVIQGDGITFNSTGGNRTKSKVEHHSETLNFKICLLSVLSMICSYKQCMLCSF